jgi:HNH endonuclease
MARKPGVFCGGGCGSKVWRRSDGVIPVCRECRRKLRQRVCEQCGEPFEARNQSRPNAPARFCSIACRTAARTLYESRRAGSKASTRKRKLRHAETWDGVEDSQILDRDDWTCRIPGCELGPIPRDRVFPDPLSASIDHIVPESLGGADTAPNKRAAHLICNTRRGNRMHPDDVQVITPELAPLGLLPARCRCGQRRKPVRLPWPKRMYYRPCRWCPAVVPTTKPSRSEFTVCPECFHGKCSKCSREMPVVVNSRPPETRQCQHCSRSVPDESRLWWTTVRP